MNSKHWMLCGLIFSFVLCGCQHGPWRSQEIEVQYEVASPVELALGVLIDGEAVPGACEVYVWAILRTPDSYAGRRVRLVLQRGRASSRDDWLSIGDEWRPIGSMGIAKADNHALSKGEILLLQK